MDTNGHTSLYEDYVSFETAKLLKEKGFDEKCSSVWRFTSNSPKGKGEWILYNYEMADEDSIWNPTLQMAMKWLREKYNYQIIAIPEHGDVEYMPGQWQEEFLGWKYTIIPFNGNKSIMYPSVYSVTTESAYEAAIKYCLENLI